MQTLYSLLQKPTKVLLAEHGLTFFNPIIRRFPNDFVKIIGFINDCYNYKSPHLVQEKAWEAFLLERYNANKLPAGLKEEILELKSDEFVLATDEFLKFQKEPIWETLVLKQNFRLTLMAVIRDFNKSLADKKIANELINNLDVEINSIFESLRQSQQVFGNYKGYDAIANAKNKIKINIASFIDEGRN